MNSLKLLLVVCILTMFTGLVAAAVSDPLITNWVKSTGYNDQYDAMNNVFRISYSSDYVYIYSDAIPSYSIGPWSSNPNNPKAQKFIYKISRSVSVPSTKIAVSLGSIGTFTNGVPMFNADDGQTYNNQGTWKRNAYVWEKVSFDSCLGHPQQQGVYHLHINPTCLYASTDSSKHSPIIGYIFDGSPVYGVYGYSSANDSTSAISRMRTSYRTRSALTNSGRNTLPDGTSVSGNSAGPAVNSEYPLGSFIQDYEYSSGLGDLDEHNGRWCVTPEYPNGVYAYFATVDSSNVPEYPYLVGDTYHGNWQSQSHRSPNEDVTVYYNDSRNGNDFKRINFLLVLSLKIVYDFIYM